MIYQLLWLAFSCPALVGKYYPAAVQPLLCRAEVKNEQFNSLDDARDRLDDLGPDAHAVLQGCHGSRCVDIDVHWSPQTKGEK